MLHFILLAHLQTTSPTSPQESECQIASSGPPGTLISGKVFPGLESQAGRNQATPGSRGLHIPVLPTSPKSSALPARPYSPEARDPLVPLWAPSERRAALVTHIPGPSLTGSPSGLLLHAAASQGHPLFHGDTRPCHQLRQQSRRALEKFT